MNTEHASRPRARLRSLRRIALAGAIVAAAILWGLLGPDKPIRVSRETTFLTEPLAADGLPDYRAAMLAAIGPAPKPEDNAAAEHLQVMWPLSFEEADLPMVCKALGIPNVAPADLLQSPSRWAEKKVKSEDFSASQTRPWTAAEFPELDAWLVAYEAAIDRLVAASDRPQYWLPDPSLLGSKDGESLLTSGVALPRERFVASALCCRGMWHAGAGRHAAAWRDIRAVYRFSRLISGPSRVKQSLVTVCQAGSASTAADAALTCGLLALPDLPEEVLLEIRRDLDALGPLPNLADALSGERLGTIDWLVWLNRLPGGRAARRHALDFPTIQDKGSDGEPERSWRSWFQLMWWRLYTLEQAAVSTSLDWNQVLGRANAYFDALDAAVRLPTHAAQVAAFEGLEQEYGLGPRSEWSKAGTVFQGLISRNRRDKVLGDLMLGLSSPLPSSLARLQASFDLARTAAALAAWKADHTGGNDPYPETLDALVPRYLSAVPHDPFIEKPFRYERRGEGYVLASVDKNRVYDGGNSRDGWLVGAEWQATKQEIDGTKTDLVVRMPVPTPAAR
jgi:hypothetical protein